MKKFIILILTVIPIFAITYTSNRVTCSNKICLNKKNHKPINGKVKVDSHTEIDYKDGLKDGKLIKYYNNGIKKIVITYKKNRLEGTTKEYFSNGKLKDVIEYKNNFRNGRTVRYNIKGTIVSDNGYKNGLKDGMSSTYNYKGRLVKRVPYKNGLKYGIETAYKNRNVVSQVPYVHGYASGTAKYYYKDGTIQKSVIFKGGVAISGKKDDGFGDKVNLTTIELDRLTKRVSK